MSAPEVEAGWAWLDAAPGGERAPPELCQAAAACLGTAHGRRLLRHLRQSFLDRRLAPTATDAELRHVEGQRSVVAHLLRLIERGRDGGNSENPTFLEPEAPR